MPTGVLPITAVATEVAYGLPGATVVHRDGGREHIDLEDLAAYVTEPGNPGNERQVSRVSARAALGARLVGEVPDMREGGEFAAFSRGLAQFVEVDLVKARLDTARSELARLAHELDDTLRIEAPIAELDAATLAERVGRLRAAAAGQRQAFEDERALLERARRELAGEFDKHAGRARWDLAQRLDAVRRRFEIAMAAEPDRSVETIVAATARAECLRSTAEAERHQQEQFNCAARKAAEVALALVGDH